MKINIKQEYQTIRGFGCSSAWWSSGINNFEVLDTLINLLYSKDGIDLNIYRYNIGAGSLGLFEDQWRVTECFETKRGEYDFNVDNYAMHALKNATKYGLDDIILFANSPQQRLCESTKTYGREDGGENIDKINFADFSNFLLDTATHMRNLGINVTEISPINEPNWNWGRIDINRRQEGCYYTPQHCADFLKFFQGEIKSRRMDFEVSIGEIGCWEQAFMYLDCIIKNNVVVTSFDAHSYWTTKEHRENFKILKDYRYPNIKLNMSELCHMKSGRDQGINSAMWMAKQMYEDFTILNVVSWQWWIGVSKYDFNDALIDYYEDSNKYVLTKRYYVMGHYSKYVPKGAVRVEVQTDSQLMVTSFKNDKDIIMVVVNDTPSVIIDEIHDYKIKNKVVTTDESSLLEVEHNYEYAPNSITTIIIST